MVLLGKMTIILYGVYMVFIIKHIFTSASAHSDKLFARSENILNLKSALMCM